jgi:phosphopantetheinyl transferase
MSKWYGISNEGDMYCLGKCKNVQEANEVADDMGVDIVSLIPQEQAETWAKFIFETIHEEDEE